MGKITFNYGVMNSSKTANLLMSYYAYKYNQSDKKIYLLKPRLDTRDGEYIIKSRTGISAKCEYVEDYLENKEYCDYIFIDEAQFLTKEQVDELVGIVDTYDCELFAYGLKNNFLGELFEGSKRLIEVADNLVEIPTICWCGKKATHIARIKDGEFIKSGDIIDIGGNDKYISLCREHYILEKDY